MRIRAITRLVAALSVLAFFAASCGDDDPITSAGQADADAPATDDTDAEHDAMHGEAIEFEGSAVPTIEIEVVSDPAGGVNIGISTTNYTIAPRSASAEHVEGEGHFHLYVDGEKVLRFYNEWIYFAGVAEGEVEIMVELSANDHRPYAHNGEPLYAMTTFSVPDHTHDAHSHDEPTEVEFAGPAPTLSVEVLPDPKSGYNAFIEVDGIVLSGEHASQDPVDGEGHLHIYVNGQKLGRLYGEATHIGALPEGDLEIIVAAYSNDHHPYVVDGQPVEAQTTITVG
jgi:hypothetical protein